MSGTAGTAVAGIRSYPSKEKLKPRRGKRPRAGRSHTHAVFPRNRRQRRSERKNTKNRGGSLPCSCFVSLFGTGPDDGKVFSAEVKGKGICPGNEDELAVVADRYLGTVLADEEQRAVNDDDPAC